MVGEDAAELEQDSMTTTATLRRRALLPRPLLWLLAGACCVGLVVAAVGQEGNSNGPLAEDPGTASSTTTPTTTRPATSPVSFSPLPLDLPSIFVQLQRGDEVLGVAVNADGSYSTTDFGSHPVFTDANGTHVAYIDEGGVLWAGPLDAMAVVDAWTAAFVWHDTVPGTLLYSTLSPDGRPEVVQWSATEPTHTRQLVGTFEGDPSWFGSSGFSLAGLDGVELRSRQGDLVRHLPAGNLMSESPDGVVYFTGEIDSMVVDTASGEVGVPSYLRAKRLIGTALSADGKMAALLSQRARRELFIVTQDSAADITHITDFPWSGASLAWGSDHDTLGFVTDPNRPQVGFIDVGEARSSLDPVVHAYDLALLGTVVHVRIR